MAVQLTRQDIIMTARSHPLDRYLNTLGEGLVDWIGVRPRRREPLMAVPSVLAVADRGLEGDHRMAKTPARDGRLP